MENKELDDCISRRKIIKMEQIKILAPKELELASEDLKVAGESLAKDNYKWATIQSYYSMFHAARSLLYRKGYREKSHYCLIEAIRIFYVSEGLLSFKFTEALQLAKSLRENADYYGDFNKENTERLIAISKDFLKESRVILEND